jgi:hypothetical protein
MQTPLKERRHTQGPATKLEACELRGTEELVLPRVLFVHIHVSWAPHDMGMIVDVFWVVIFV